MAEGCKSALVVGIGLPEDLFEITDRRLKAQKCKIQLKRADDPHELIFSLKNGRIDAAVRGTLGATEVLKELKTAFSLSSTMRVAVMSAQDGKTFLLAPVGIDEGRDIESRLSIVRSSVSYFSRVGWTPTVAVLSKGRPEDAHRGEDIRHSIKEGEKIAAILKREGIEAKHAAILIEEAVKDADLVLVPDGVSGNLVFRALHFVGGMNAFGAPIVNMDKVFVDTSRAKSDFSEPILLAAGLARGRSKRGGVA
jgi:putative methanogen marker protein 4